MGTRKEKGKTVIGMEVVGESREWKRGKEKKEEDGAGADGAD